MNGEDPTPRNLYAVAFTTALGMAVVTYILVALFGK